MHHPPGTPARIDPVPGSFPQRSHWVLLGALWAGVGTGLVWTTLLVMLFVLHAFVFAGGFQSSSGSWTDLFPDVASIVLLAGPFLMTVATVLVGGVGLLVSRRVPRRAVGFTVVIGVGWSGFVVTWWAVLTDLLSL